MHTSKDCPGLDHVLNGHLTELQKSLLYRALNTERNLIKKELERTNNSLTFREQHEAINGVMIIFDLED